MSRHVDSQVPLIKNTPSFSREKKTQQNKHKSIKGSRGLWNQTSPFVRSRMKYCWGGMAEFLRTGLTTTTPIKPRGVLTSLTNQANRVDRWQLLVKNLLKFRKSICKIAAKNVLQTTCLLVQNVRCQSVQDVRCQFIFQLSSLNANIYVLYDSWDMILSKHPRSYD